MFNGNRDGDNDPDEDVDEYFDDAGDIGYLPADHVSFKIILISNYKFIALNGPSSSCVNKATNRRARASRFITKRERRRSKKCKEAKRRYRCSDVWSIASTSQNVNQIRAHSRQLQHCK